MSDETWPHSRLGTALLESSGVPALTGLFLALHFGMRITSKQEQALSCLFLSISPQYLFQVFYNVPEVFLFNCLIKLFKLFFAVLNLFISNAEL